MGFAARAIKTMGLGSMRIVGLPLHDSVEARKTGYQSHDVLNNVLVYKELSEALADMDLAIGTTSKSRIKRYDGHTPSAIAEILRGKREMLNNVALVFGSEENGLTTRELDRCDLISTIPMNTRNIPGRLYTSRCNFFYGTAYRIMPINS